jgi:hypothetical protein
MISPPCKSSALRGSVGPRQDARGGAGAL